MPTIKNLTGSVWEFKSTLDLEGFSGSYSFVINFTSNGNNYSSIELHLPYQSEYIPDWMNYDLTNVYDDSGPSSKWSNDAYKTISIINGKDVTNENLINWLQQNATVQSYSKEVVLHPYNSGEASYSTILLPRVLSDDSKQDVFQYDTMPEATSEMMGKIVQYTGASTSSYTCGYFYTCTSSGASYSWVLSPVQPSSSGQGISTSEIIERENDTAYPVASNSDIIQYQNDLYFKKSPDSGSRYTYMEISIGDHPFATTGDINNLCGKYSITGEIENGSMSGDAFIWSGESAHVTIVPNTDYTLPSTITVTNASYTYDSTTGAVTLSNATGNVIISATCESAAWGGTDLTGTTWEFKTTDPSRTSIWSYELDFESNNEDFDSIRSEEIYMSPSYGLYYGSTLAFDGDINNWTDNSYKTIIITGGTDATNSTLISWLQDNATLISW